MQAAVLDNLDKKYSPANYCKTNRILEQTWILTGGCLHAGHPWCRFECPSFVPVIEQLSTIRTAFHTKEAAGVSKSIRGQSLPHTLLYMEEP